VRDLPVAVPTPKGRARVPGQDGIGLHRRTGRLADTALQPERNRALQLRSAPRGLLKHSSFVFREPVYQLPTCLAGLWPCAMPREPLTNLAVSF
jgi:hypothetical protein